MIKRMVDRLVNWMYVRTKREYLLDSMRRSTDPSKIRHLNDQLRSLK